MKTTGLLILFVSFMSMMSFAKDASDEDLATDYFMRLYLHVLNGDDASQEKISRQMEFPIPEDKVDQMRDIFKRVVTFRSALKRMSYFKLYRTFGTPECSLIEFYPRTHDLIVAHGDKVSVIGLEGSFSISAEPITIGKKTLPVSFIQSMDVAGTQIAVAKSDGTIHILKRGSTQIKSFVTDNSSGIPYSLALYTKEDPRVIAVGTSDGNIHIKGIYSRMYDHVLKKPDGGSTFALLFHPDATLVAGDFDGKIITWSGDGKYQQSILEGHTNTIRALVLNPDGSLLASGGDDGAIRLWDWSTKHEVKRLEGFDSVESIAFSPTQWILVASGHDRNGFSIKVWDMKTYQEIETGMDHQIYGIEHVKFSDDGLYMASSSTGGVINVWEVIPQFPDLGLLYMGDHTKDGDKK